MIRTTLCWLAILPIYVEAVKTCYTMVANGAHHHPDVDGYYDVVTDMHCHGRDVYQHRDILPGYGPMFIYYCEAAKKETGWVIGTRPCMDDLSYTYLLTWHINKRPDRGLVPWKEYSATNDTTRPLKNNKNFSVLCTEGLTYPEIVGIITGCVVGVFIIIVLSVFVYHQCRT